VTKLGTMRHLLHERLPIRSVAHVARQHEAVGRSTRTSIPILRILLTCLFLPAGCTDRSATVPAQADAVVVEDSAGVETFSVDRDRLAVAWELSPVPEWTIGNSAAGGHGDLDLNGVIDVAIVDDSLVAIAEYPSAQLILARTDGSLVRRVGGRGDGPAEFQGLQRVFGASGRVGAWDSDRRRYVEFDLAGRLQFESQVVLLPGVLSMKVVSGGGSGGVDRDSLWWWTWPRVTAAPGETVRPPGALIRLLDLQDTLALATATRAPGSRRAGRRPFVSVRHQA
jgi:hypothetical protein